MGGNIDTQGLNDFALAVGRVRQEQIARREQEAERQRVLGEQQKQRRLQAAQTQWDLVKHLPEGDPQREAAAANLEQATRDYSGTDFAIPKKTIGAKPAVTARVPTPPADALEAPKPGQQTPTQEITFQQADPGKQVYDLPGAQPEVDEEKVLQAVRTFQNQIAGASAGAARKQAVDQANAWKKAVVSRYPQIAHLIPDFESTAKTFDDEDRQRAAAAVAQAGFKKWESAMVAAQKQLQTAFAGTDPIALIDAIKARRELAAAGKQAGYTGSGAYDRAAQLSEIRNILTAWAAKITDAAKLYAILPVLQQYGIKPTPNQQKLIDLMLGQKQKSAAPPKGRQGPKRVVEDTGL